MIRRCGFWCRNICHCVAAVAITRTAMGTRQMLLRNTGTGCQIDMSLSSAVQNCMRDVREVLRVQAEVGVEVGHERARGVEAELVARRPQHRVRRTPSPRTCPTTMPGSRGSRMWRKARNLPSNSSRRRVTFSMPPRSVSRVMIAQTRSCSG